MGGADFPSLFYVPRPGVAYDRLTFLRPKDYLWKCSEIEFIGFLKGKGENWRPEIFVRFLDFF
jgi:hypothetical protein